MLTVGPSLERIGAGAFDYDFGALDDTDNPFTKSYTNVLYDYLSPSSVVQSSRRADRLYFVSFAAFRNPSRLLVLSMTITGWFPGLITWLFDNSKDPGMQQLRWNKEQGRIVARKLLDSKRQELKDGVARRDVMSLLGLFLATLVSAHLAVDTLSTAVKSSDSQRQDTRLTDEEIIPQVQ